ncbi:PIG-L deacetylase family protein [Dactylosporangium sp. NPDC049140]|uniref:PIG-L deacetylase family protein n=1 Tax=Dactylosporangium sp. NPDC049140 TaxID=3155647 RepID=UPI0033DE879A
MTTPPVTVPALREDWQRALCVAAHPDDLEYGVASAVARWTAQGKQVVYLLVTRGEAGIDGLDPSEAGPLREAEQRAAGNAVGVDELEFLDYTDGVVEYGLGLRRDLARAIRRHRPDIVITGSYADKMDGGFVNQADHRAVGLATLDAVRDAANRWVFRELSAEGHTPWAGVQTVLFNTISPVNCGVDVTDYLEQGKTAMRAHHSYFAGLGEGVADPGEIVAHIATEAGRQMGVPAATLFEAYVLDPTGPPPWETA